jgi:hypothetical protein
MSSMGSERLPFFSRGPSAGLKDLVGLTPAVCTAHPELTSSKLMQNHSLPRPTVQLSFFCVIVIFLSDTERARVTECIWGKHSKKNILI